RYADSDTFHPLFLYESLWSLLGVLVLLLVWRSRRVRPPGLFCLYVAWYTFGRFFLEFVRTDEAHELLGLRLNNYVALALFLASLAALWWALGGAGPAPGDPARPAPTPARSMAVPKGRVRPRR
ncbi:MAG: prolipoprotein diacylglyceryl transferase, partial [Thermoleophilia bacterium]|nr:prolipoprotein diacylglyceryl transferase [Thermoleophilia bacterium]